MRRRLTVQAAAVTSMVALAFILPLAVLVRDFAADRALTAAERQAENVARYMALRSPDQLEARDLEELTLSSQTNYQISVISPDGDVLGDEVPEDEDLSAAFAGTAERFVVNDGGVVYLPVIGQDGQTSVVRVFITREDMRVGVTRSWVILGALGLALVAIAVLIADWIGRTVVRPVADLSSSAAKLGSGDFGARVTPQGPEEIKAMGVEFNRLADQIDQFLVSEREAAADLSHRLRTPLTALRLDLEALEDIPGRERVLDDLLELERTVDYVIDQAQRGARRGLPTARVDIARVAEERVAFWNVLAEDQNRDVTTRITGDRVLVAMEPDDASAMIDALIGNVFAHTEEGVPFGVTVLAREEDVLLAVEDGGPGLPDEGVLERGRSSSSSGLGLDIARKSAEGGGGDFRVGESRRLGGALIAIRLPLAAD